MLVRPDCPISSTKIKFAYFFPPGTMGVVLWSYLGKSLRASWPGFIILAIAAPVVGGSNILSIGSVATAPMSISAPTAEPSGTTGPLHGTPVPPAPPPEQPQPEQPPSEQPPGLHPD